MRTLRFLFWNLNRKPILDLVAEAALENRTNIVILAENSEPIGLGREFFERHGLSLSTPSLLCDRVQIFSSLPASEVQAIADDKYWSVQQIQMRGARPVLLVGLHLPSKRQLDSASQSANAEIVSQKTLKLETRVKRTWTMFDQVLLRSEFANAWKPGQVRILGSDHLPIAFKVDCE